MLGDEVYKVYEVNDLQNPELSKSGKSSKKKASSNSEATSQAANGSGGASGGLGGLAGAIGGVISAVVSVTLLIAVVTTYIVAAPQIFASNWKILYNSISFVFSAEESDNDFVINLYEGDSLLETIATDSLEKLIKFDNLEGGHRYTITVENDYGSGLTKIKEFNITTAGTPVFLNGKVKVLNHNINYATSTLTVSLMLEDEHGYLSNFRMEADDGNESFEVLRAEVLPESLDIPLHNLRRGYITITVYADSTSQYSLPNGLLTTYKIYY